MELIITFKNFQDLLSNILLKRLKIYSEPPCRFYVEEGAKDMGFYRAAARLGLNSVLFWLQAKVKVAVGERVKKKKAVCPSKAVGLQQFRDQEF